LLCKLTVGTGKLRECAGQSYKSAVQVNRLDKQVEPMDMQRDQIAVQVDRLDRQVEKMCCALGLLRRLNLIQKVAGYFLKSRGY
jgi:hypothetical protein